jgi:hypothetical protein
MSPYLNCVGDGYHHNGCVKRYNPLCMPFADDVVLVNQSTMGRDGSNRN